MNKNALNEIFEDKQFTIGNKTKNKSTIYNFCSFEIKFIYPPEFFLLLYTHIYGYSRLYSLFAYNHTRKNSG